MVSLLKDRGCLACSFQTRRSSGKAVWKRPSLDPGLSRDWAEERVECVSNRRDSESVGAGLSGACPAEKSGLRPAAGKERPLCAWKEPWGHCGRRPADWREQLAGVLRGVGWGCGDKLMHERPGLSRQVGSGVPGCARGPPVLLCHSVSQGVQGAAGL